jgi:hypothetical protein
MMMRKLLATFCGLIGLLAICVTSLAADDATALLKTIKSAAPGGENSAEVAAAWKQLVAQGPGVLTDTLAAMDDASPLAANWLRGAADAIAEKAIDSGKPPDAGKLETFVKDTKHTGAPRRLAYEWLVRIDRDAPARLLPTMLDDPGSELRRDAVAWALKDAQKILDSGDKEGAKQAFQKLFAAARDRDQVSQIGEQLRKLGAKVDVMAKYGLVTRWMLAGPFDNTNVTGFAKGFPPEDKIDLKATFEGKGGKATKWIEHTVTEPAGAIDPNKVGVVDLNTALGKNMAAVGYAFAAVESATERPVEIRAGSNNAVKIFLNGKPIFSHDEYHHGSRMDQHIGRGTLKPGRNEILIKVCQNNQTDNWAQRWDFQLRICDALGGAVPVKILEEK